MTTRERITQELSKPVERRSPFHPTLSRDEQLVRWFGRNAARGSYLAKYWDHPIDRFDGGRCGFTDAQLAEAQQLLRARGLALYMGRIGLWVDADAPGPPPRLPVHYGPEPGPLKRVLLRFLGLLTYHFVGSYTHDEVSTHEPKEKP